MKNMFNLLATTDYSIEGTNAIRYAMMLAKETQSTLDMLHVYKIPYSAIPAGAEEFAKTKVDFFSSELQTLTHHRSNLLSDLDIKDNEVKGECLVHEGSVGKCIRETADESDYDFIIMGTHGASGFLEKIFGGNTWDMVKKSPVPILAIPPEARFNGIKNIVFATEYREGELPVIHFLVQLAKKFEANLTILHVSAHILPKDIETELFEDFKTSVRDKVNYVKLSLRVVYNENVVTGINTHCLKSETDLLVVSPQKPSLLDRIIMPESIVTRKLCFKTHVPLLAIPDYYNPEYSKFWKVFSMDEKTLTKNI